MTPTNGAAAERQDPQREMSPTVTSKVPDDTVNGGAKSVPAIREEFLSVAGDVSTKALGTSAAAGTEVIEKTAVETGGSRDLDSVLSAKDAARGVQQVVSVSETPEGVAGAAAELTYVEPARKDDDGTRQASEQGGEEEMVVVASNALEDTNRSGDTYGNWSTTSLSAGGRVRHRGGITWRAGAGRDPDDDGVATDDSLSARLERLGMGGTLAMGRARPLAEWVKEGSVDDSDAETTTSR